MTGPTAKINPIAPGAAADDLTTARAVIKGEMAGLQALAEGLDDNFIRAVDQIGAMRADRRGRLIVSGMGKSGHVARKMVATFSSTGVPSYFVHPAEASHGDLGIITGDDVVILISNSGESREQGDLLAYTRRFNIPLIAITRVADSTLGRAADILLRLPDVPEAFSDVVAPTTSAVATMALGDALAEALMKRAGITPDQFKVFHPGGKLGQQLLKVADIMIAGDQLPLIAPTATMDAAIMRMTETNVGCVLVVDAAQTLCGIITDGDLKRHMGPDLLTKSVQSVMSAHPAIIGPELLAVEALSHMQNHRPNPITALVVVDASGVTVGLIRVQECMQAGVM